MDDSELDHCRLDGVDRLLVDRPRRAGIPEMGCAVMLGKLPLNFELLSNPVNWIIVVLMVTIAGIFFTTLFGAVAVNAGSTSNV